MTNVSANEPNQNAPVPRLVSDLDPGEVHMKAQGTTLYPFVPSGPDFAASLAFFQELGFEKRWANDGLAGLWFGNAYFMLQDIDVPEWQKNQMITFEVDDLERY